VGARAEETVVATVAGWVEARAVARVAGWGAGWEAALVGARVVGWAVGWVEGCEWQMIRDWDQHCPGSHK
jgi:hypothetical protein